MTSPPPPGLSPPPRQAIPVSDWEFLVYQQANILEKQTDIFRRVIEANKSLEERAYRSMEDVDLSVKEVEMWKKAFIEEQKKSEKAEKELMVLKKHLDALDDPKGRDSIVLALIDGDGYIFKDELLQRGRDGGHDAAQMLNESILAHVSKGDNKNTRVQVWTYIFFNLKGLLQTVVGGDVCSAEEFEAFIIGFNQANSRFTINDVHSGKEAADTKIKAYLQTWTRFPQTLKVYFGGGHDNGYHPTLAELKSDGLLDKIILLQGYEQIANEIRSLQLSTLQIDGLFRADKISVKPVKRASPPSSIVSTSKPPSYTSVVETSRPYAQTVMQPVARSESPVINKRLRRLNPNLEMHKHNPPPCNLFYLSKCNKGAECKYAHDYILEAEDYEALRENAKKSPCPAVNMDSPCPFGDSCALGHKCPYGPHCFHRKLDKCWFRGKTMHT